MIKLKIIFLSLCILLSLYFSFSVFSVPSVAKFFILRQAIICR
jgi:hypothetical protein